MATCNVDSLLSQANCFACQSPGLWPILELQLLCNILSAGGGGGGGQQVFSGAGDPTAGGVVPAVSNALYIDTNTGTLYQWYSNLWH